MSFWFRKGGLLEGMPTMPYEPSSPEGLAARWVQWVAASGPLKNPVEDEDGRHAAHNQPDDVWFLAGTSGRQLQRRCTVPAGRDLFLPAFNFWMVPAEGPPPVPDQAFGRLEVDGEEVELDEISTPRPFVVAGARLNGVTRSRRVLPVTVWGLWKRVPALAPGAHTVRAVGGDGYGFTVDVGYSLTVAAGVPDYSVR